MRTVWRDSQPKESNYPNRNPNYNLTNRNPKPKPNRNPKPHPNPNPIPKESNYGDGWTKAKENKHDSGPSSRKPKRP